MGFRNEITGPPGPVMKCVREYTAQVGHGGFIRIDRQTFAAAQITKTPAIVQSHDMVSMRMSKNDCIQPANVFAQHLDAELWSGIDDKSRLTRFHVDGWTGSMVLRVRQKLGWIFFAN